MTSKRLYAIPRKAVADRLTTLVRLPHFHVKNRRAVLRALQLLGTATHLDFGDAVLIALMQLSGERVIYSYDTDFDRLPGIGRQGP